MKEFNRIKRNFTKLKGFCSGMASRKCKGGYRRISKIAGGFECEEFAVWKDGTVHWKSSKTVRFIDDAIKFLIG